MDTALSTQAVVVTVISSIVSGILGAVLSVWYFYKLERHKLKLDVARRLLGNRFDLKGDAFSCAINEVIVVFADSEDVLSKMAQFHSAVKVAGANADSALLDFIISVCRASGLAQKTLNDTYIMEAFNIRP